MNIPQLIYMSCILGALKCCCRLFLLDLELKDYLVNELWYTCRLWTPYVEQSSRRAILNSNVELFFLFTLFSMVVNDSCVPTGCTVILSIFCYVCRDFTIARNWKLKSMKNFQLIYSLCLKVLEKVCFFLIFDEVVNKGK